MKNREKEPFQLDGDPLWYKDAIFYEVHDLLTDARYVWRGPRNYVELHPSTVPAHVFRVR